MGGTILTTKEGIGQKTEKPTGSKMMQPSYAKIVEEIAVKIRGEVRITSTIAGKTGGWALMRRCCGKASMNLTTKNLRMRNKITSFIERENG
jgi:hypothetical protein